MVAEADVIERYDHALVILLLAAQAFVPRMNVEV